MKKITLVFAATLAACGPTPDYELDSGVIVFDEAGWIAEHGIDLGEIEHGLETLYDCLGVSSDVRTELAYSVIYFRETCTVGGTPVAGYAKADYGYTACVSVDGKSTVDETALYHEYAHLTRFADGSDPDYSHADESLWSCVRVAKAE